MRNISFIIFKKIFLFLGILKFKLFVEFLSVWLLLGFVSRFVVFFLFCS